MVAGGWTASLAEGLADFRRFLGACPGRRLIFCTSTGQGRDFRAGSGLSAPMRQCFFQASAQRRTREEEGQAESARALRRAAPMLFLIGIGALAHWRISANETIPENDTSWNPVLAGPERAIHDPVMNGPAAVSFLGRLHCTGPARGGSGCGPARGITTSGETPAADATSPHASASALEQWTRSRRPCSAAATAASS